MGNDAIHFIMIGVPLSHFLRLFFPPMILARAEADLLKMGRAVSVPFPVRRCMS